MILDPESATRTRWGAETRDADTGRATRPTPSTTSFEGGFQPLKGSERKALPEGVRSSVKWKCYTTTDLRTADQHAKTPADRVTYDGEDYTVWKVEKRGLLDHYKAYLMREQETP